MVIERMRIQRTMYNNMSKQFVYTFQFFIGDKLFKVYR